MAEPMASGYLSLTSVAHSDGWILVPAESEGFADGTLVAVNRWP
jgi:molybdopterin biosynthesis enzyme